MTHTLKFSFLTEAGTVKTYSINNAVASPSISDIEAAALHFTDGETFITNDGRLVKTDSVHMVTTSREDYVVQTQ